MEWYFILLIILGVLIFIIASLVIWYIQYITPIPTGKISDRVLAIRTGIVNSFVYSKGSKKILIDTGTSAKKLKKGLDQIKIKPKSISDIFFTHGDPDHIGGNSIFHNAQFYIGEKSQVKDPENYKFLTNNEVIKIGEIKIEVISAPGHRLGHMIYRIDDEILFTGDALRLKKGVVKPFLRIISSDYNKQVETIQMISKLSNIEYMFTAHNGYTDDFKKSFDEWR